MVRHTLRTLGPKVLASRMVRDYVIELYMPAAQSGRAVDGPGYVAAKELADLEGPGAQGLAVGAGRPRRVQRRRREPASSGRR